MWYGHSVGGVASGPGFFCQKVGNYAVIISPLGRSILKLKLRMLKVRQQLLEGVKSVDYLNVNT